MAGYIETCYDFIRKASKEGRLVLFVGAGVSKNSGIPTWWELIDKLAVDVGIKTDGGITADDVLYIPQIYYNERGYVEYVKKIKEILDVDVEPNPIHRIIFNLKPNHIITTNYDTLLEKEMTRPETEIEYSVIRKNTDAAHCNNSHLLIKMHGDFKDNNFVLKEDDYLSYKRNFQLVETVVKSVFATNLIVFIGFSAKDPNFKLIYQWVKDILLHDCQPTYLLESESKITSSQFNYFRSQGIHLVPYEEKTIKKFIDIKSEYYGYRDELVDIRGKRLYEHLLAIQNLSTPPRNLFDALSLEQIVNSAHAILSTFAHIPALSISDILDAVDSYRVRLTSQFNKLLILDEKTVSVIVMSRRYSVVRNLTRKIRDVYQILQKAGIEKIIGKGLVIRMRSASSSIEVDEEADFLGFVEQEQQINSLLERDSQTQSFFERLQLGRLLALAGRVKEANRIFKEVAIDSLAANDVLSWYFSQYNRRILARILWANVLAYRGMEVEEIYEIRNYSQYVSIQTHPDFSSKLNLLNNNPILSQFINSVEYSRHIQYARGQLNETLKEAKEFLDQSLKGLGGSLHSPTLTSKSYFYITSLFSFTEGNGVLFDFLPEFREVCQLHVATVFALVSAPDLGGDPRFRSREATQLDSFTTYLAIHYVYTKELSALLEDYQLASNNFSTGMREYLTGAFEDLVQYCCDYIRKNRLFFHSSYVSNYLLISKSAGFSMEQNSRFLASVLKYLSNEGLEVHRDVFRYLSAWIKTLNRDNVSSEISLDFIKCMIEGWRREFFHKNAILTSLVSTVDVSRFRSQIQEVFVLIQSQFESWQNSGAKSKIELANDILIPCLPLFSQKDQQRLQRFLKEIFKEEWKPETADAFFRLIYRTDYRPTQIELRCYFSLFLHYLRTESFSSRDFEITSIISAQIVHLLREGKIGVTHIPNMSSDDLEKVPLLSVVVHPLNFKMNQFNVSWLAILPMQTVRKLAADKKSRQAIIIKAKQSSSLPEEFFKYFTKKS